MSMDMRCNANAVSHVQYIKLKTIVVSATSVEEFRYLFFFFNYFINVKRKI